MISTQSLESLPDIPSLVRLTQSLAMLDAILCPEWESRYYSFNSRWADGKMMASMRNGSGDHWFQLFGEDAAILKGFAHESPLARSAPWPGVLSEVPARFDSFLSEPAFSIDETTFCVWRTPDADRWQRGRIAYPTAVDPDGSADLLAILDGTPRTYQQWAEEYYEADLDIADVEHIYEHRPLTLARVSRLNAELTMEELSDDLKEIGYPT